MAALKKDSSMADEPKNKRVGSPADKPKTTSCFLEKLYSMALAANRPVQKMMVNGLDRVKISAEIKLEKRLPVVAMVL